MRSYIFMHRSARLIYIFSLVLFPFFVLGPLGGYLENLPLRLIVFCLLALGEAWLFRRAWPGHGWGAATLVTALAGGAVYKLASFIPDVSTYPFSLEWSEVSRYYYASLFFSERIYGLHVPPSVLHFTRYLMQAVPFLIPDAPLWLHRAWQVVLWVVTAGGMAWVIKKKLAVHSSQLAAVGLPSSLIRNPLYAVSFLLFAFLFLFQGPIYYHLLVMGILVLWGYDRHHFWRTLLIVLLASIWAGVSRVNWLPVPGMLAAALYLLESPIEAGKTEGKQSIISLRYLIPPVLWTVLGTAAGYLTQLAYQRWSGNPPEVFGSSFSSDLLWYRLWPNPTYPLGILPSAILVSLPLVLLAALRLAPRWRRFGFIRLLGLGAILFVLFVGGVLVSVKIGGGSNLHNLDAYLVMLLVICSIIYFNVPLITKSDQGRRVAGRLEAILLAAAIAIPIYYTLVVGGQLPQRDFAAAQTVLQTIRDDVHQAKGEVLFISQRHLLTFHMLEDQSSAHPIPLVPDDELVFLMEMAMANNRPYLDAFQHDVEIQRYALIVTGPLNTNYQGRSHSFGEENDAWVRQVSEPVLCYYQPLVTWKDPAIQLLVPRIKPCK
jgi:hypothetical protein